MNGEKIENSGDVCLFDNAIFSTNHLINIKQMQNKYFLKEIFVLISFFFWFLFLLPVEKKKTENNVKILPFISPFGAYSSSHIEPTKTKTVQTKNVQNWSELRLPCRKKWFFIDKFVFFFDFSLCLKSERIIISVRPVNICFSLLRLDSASWQVKLQILMKSSFLYFWNAPREQQQQQQQKRNERTDKS